MDLELDGRVLVCTGATGGIGRPTARLLAAEGARLVLIDRDEFQLRELAADLEGPGHIVLAQDLRDPASAGAIAAAARSCGRVDGLAHLAAVMLPVDFDDIGVEIWDLHQEVNVRGAFLLARALAAEMTAGDGGRIALVSSGAWLSGGLPDRLPYAVSKGAVTTMVRALARALGPRGVAVNGVAPGMVETAMMDAGLDSAVRRSLEEQTPLGRFAAPEEIAPLIAFLLSPASSFVSGSTLVASGGLVLH